MAPLEPWEKVLVDAETFPNSIHGQIECQECHGGVQSPDKEIAHEGLIAYPSRDPEGTCGTCHPNVVAHNEMALHTNLAGYWTVLEERGAQPNNPHLQEGFQNHCTECHATCGECHVSQPRLVGSGFIDGHNFNETPSMTRNCTACHGSRVGNEYLGKHEDLKADVHFRQGRMTCVDCHTGEEMHGNPDDCASCHPGPEANQLPPPDHRYSGVQTPSCESCHPNVSTGQDEIIMHQMHGSTLSCQVCHSVSYTSCDNCHLEISEQTGNPFFTTEASYFTFLIGKNPLQNYARPYDYVTVRHVPVHPESFSFYADNLLPDFNALETWKYSTPHNIQRNTPQTESCNACHGNPEYFLTADKVYPEELEANLDVIIDVIPPPITSTIQIP